MDPIDVMMNEHQKILQVLACLEKMVWRSGDRGRIGEEPARGMIRFFREYADGIHHGKEEKVYFPALNERELSSADLLREHAEGRLLVSLMESAIPGAAEGNPDALDKFKQAAAQFIFMLRRHIRKEDHFLFPVGDLTLDAAKQAWIREQFAQSDRADAEHIAGLLALADRLADAFGVSKERQQFGDGPG